MREVVASFLTLLLMACSGPEAASLPFDSYSAACSTSGDCAAVYTGEICPQPANQCLCANSAIADESISQYRADLSAAIDTCNVELSAACTVACENRVNLSCVDRKCVFDIVE